MPETESSGTWMFLDFRVDASYHFAIILACVLATEAPICDRCFNNDMMAKCAPHTMIYYAWFSNKFNQGGRLRPCPQVQSISCARCKHLPEVWWRPRNKIILEQVEFEIYDSHQHFSGGMPEVRGGTPEVHWRYASLFVYLFRISGKGCWELHANS